MAFTRKFLAAQGIEADKADAIMAAHVEVVEYHKEQYSEIKEQLAEMKTKASEINELNNKLEEANSKLSEANAKIEAYEKDDYKGKYESEKAAKEKLESDIANKETNAKKETAFKTFLKGKKYSDEATKLIVSKGGYTAKIELDENGDIKNADSILSEVQNDFAVFTPKVNNQPISPAAPPANSSGKSSKTKDDILSIKNTAERQKAIAENPELFGLSN